MSAGANRWVIFLWGIAPALALLLLVLSIVAAIHGFWFEHAALLVIAVRVALARWLWR